jgi:hypothetical protein
MKNVWKRENSEHSSHIRRKMTNNNNRFQLLNNL